MRAYILTVVLFLAGIFIMGIAIRRYYASKAEKTYRCLLQILDESLHGNLLQNRYDESMDAAIAARLNRLVQMTQMHQQDAEMDRDTVKELISDISHQIRTPLSNIMLYAGLLKEQLSGQEAGQLADRIIKQSDKLDFFMKELIKSSYAEQKMITVRPQRICVQEIIQSACQTAELSAMKKAIVIVNHTDEAEPLFCAADKKWTTEAVANVLENAVKYSPQASAVEITAVAYEVFVCIQIKDFGPGIREEEQGLVFQRFYRSDDVKETAGYGIGLYLVREVLRKQGGYARIQSEYGTGTLVQLYLLKQDADRGEFISDSG